VPTYKTQTDAASISHLDDGPFIKASRKPNGGMKSGRNAANFRIRKRTADQLKQRFAPVAIDGPHLPKVPIIVPRCDEVGERELVYAAPAEIHQTQLLLEPNKQGRRDNHPAQTQCWS
jgi:hypothetical protein